jgi:hypothetical protein
MLKSLLAAAAIALPMSMMAAAPAEAATDVRIYLGLPHFNYYPGAGFIQRPGYGWYRPGYRQLTCNQGARLLERRGYRVRAVVECGGSQYTYRVRTPKGNNIVLKLNARTGDGYR